MGIKIGSGSTWKDMVNLKVGSGGVWKQAQSVWVCVGGVWKKAWDYINADAIAINIGDFDGLQGPVNCSFQYNSNGIVYTIEGQQAAQNVGTWLLIGNNSDFQIRLTSWTGDTPSGNALDTWYTLSTSVSWGYSLGGQGFLSGSGTVQIRRTSDQAVVDSASVAMQVESTL